MKVKITTEIKKLYNCDFVDLTVYEIFGDKNDYNRLKNTSNGLRWYILKREANLYLAGYLRFLAKVKTHQAQELCAKAYRLTK